jgi:hypothetical protein
MATFPSGIVSPTNPVSGDKMNVLSHAGQHTVANDEIVAIETALGVNLANVVPAAYLSTSTTLAENSDTKVATQKAVKTYADNMVLTGGGIPIGYLDTDGTLAANSDIRVPSQKAVKTYVAAQIPTGVLGDGTVNPTNLLTNGDFERWSAGASAAPDGWTLAGGTIAREGTIIKLGTYSAKNSDDGYILQHVSNTSGKGLTYFKSRTFTFGCWVYATVANVARIAFGDGVLSSFSSYHTGDSTWQWLSITKTMSASSTLITAYCLGGYYDGAMLVEGASAFAFSPAPSELCVAKDGTVNPTNLLSNGAFEAWSAGTSAAPDGWTLGGGAVAQEGTIKRFGSFSAKVTVSSGTETMYQALAAGVVTKVKGRAVTLGCWMYATVASKVRMSVYDDVTGHTYSSYHSGNSTWEFITVTATISATATAVGSYLYVTSSTSGYFQGAICVEGASAFAFSPKPAEEGVWADYSAVSSVTGWGSFATKKIYTMKIGKLVLVQFFITGTSDATTAQFTVPYVSSAAMGEATGNLSFCQDNGTGNSTAGAIRMPDSGSVVNLYYANFTNAWTASGTKQAVGQFWFTQA